MAEQEMVAVEQCDRVAAIAWMRSTPHGSRHAEADIVERGEYDDHSIVQAFARHRLAATKAADERVRVMEEEVNRLCEENKALRGEGWRLERIGSEMPQVDVQGLLLLETSNGQAEWAKTHSTSPQYVCDVLSGRRQPGRKMLDALGLEKVVRYRIVKRC